MSQKTRKIYHNLKQLQTYFLMVFVFVFLFVFTASAATVYPPSTSFTIGEFIYEDDYTPSTADCNINVWDPSGSLIVNNVLMTEDANGWHYYNFAGSATLGTWPATMSCGTAGVDLVRGDKTFIIATTTGSTSEVADAVATLVNANTNSAIQTASSSLSATLPFSIWNYTGRSLDTIANITSGVWSYTTRLLTGKHLTTDNTELATETYVDTATSTLNTNINNTINNASSSVTSMINSNINSASSSITTMVNANTNSAIQTASSSLSATIPFSVWNYSGRSLDAITNITTGVWNIASSTVFSVGSMGEHLVSNLNGAVSNIAYSVWNYTTRLLTGKVLTDGGQLATETYVDTATSTLNTNINNTISNASSSITTLVNANTNSAIATASSSLALTIPLSVWNYSGRSLDTITNITSGVWSYTTRLLTGKSLTDGGQLATETYVDTATSTLNTNINNTISNASSSITTMVNANTNSVVNNASSSITTLVNANTNSIVNNASSSITTMVNANTNSAIATASSSLAATIPFSIWNYSGRSLDTIANITSGIASSVWGYTTRLLTGKSLTDGGELATESYVDTATSTLNTNINNTISNASSSITTLVNANTNSVVENASSSLASAIETRATLSSQQAGWVVTMSDFGETTTGQAYRVRLTTLNYESVPTDSASLPIITITDSAGSEKLPGGTTMIRDSAGVYHYNYTVPTDAVGGTWETQVATEVESGKTINTNDYWRISSSPADVLILSMADRIIPVVTASVKLMNKGTAGSDFYYVYCVVDSEANQCGGNDDVDYKSMTEYINPGETLSRSLSLDVPTAGTYWFKLKARALNEVNWAASAEQFIAESGVVGPSCGDGSCNGGETCNSCSADCGQCNNNGGGGGGGGGGTPPPVNPPPPDNGPVHIADLNKDNRVNSIDFSILLYFWRTASPFSNPYVDINKDVKVDSVDFSILLYYYGEVYD